MTMHNKITTYRQSHLNKFDLALFGLVFASLGSYIIFQSSAATPASNIEPENGTVTAPAAVVNDATASGGKAVRFGNAATGSNGSGCPLPAYPDASCTGVPAGVTLTNYTGPNPIRTDNYVVDGKLINDTIVVEASGVTIKNTKITNGSVLAGDPELYGKVPLTVMDTDIDCGSTGGSTGISEAHPHHPSGQYPRLRERPFRQPGCGHTGFIHPQPTGCRARRWYSV
jgi:hypothetical protein